MAGGGTARKGDMLPTKIEVFQHYQYLTEFKNKSGEWHKTTQKCVKAKHVVEDVANGWERGGLPQRLEDSKIVIALLDRVIRMKENQKNELCQLFDVSCCLHDDKKECDSKPECHSPLLFLNSVRYW